MHGICHPRTRRGFRKLRRLTLGAACTAQVLTGRLFSQNLSTYCRSKARYVRFSARNHGSRLAICVTWQPETFGSANFRLLTVPVVGKSAQQVYKHKEDMQCG